MPNNFPLGQAPGIYSPKLMTGRLIPVTSSDGVSTKPIHRDDVDLVGIGSRRLAGSESVNSSRPEVSASDLQNDPERSWVNLWSPRPIRPTTPKTMDNPPPEPPLPHTREMNSSASRLSHGIHKPTPESNSENSDDSIWDSFGGKIKDVTKSVSDTVGAMSPMEKGVVFGGVPLALLGAYYVHKKMKQKNK